MKNMVEKLGQRKVFTFVGIVVAVAALVLGTGMAKQNQETSEDAKPKLVSDTVTHEVNTELSTELKTYMENVDEQLDYAMDFSEVDTSKVGLYKANINYDTQEYEFNVNVIDSTAPTLTLKANKPLTFPLEDDSLDALKQMVIDAITVEDNYDENVTIDELALEQLALQEKEIEITYTMTATDSSGNIGQIKVTVQFTVKGEEKEDLPKEEVTPPTNVEKPNTGNNNGNSTETPSEVKPTSITVSPSTLSLEVGKTSKVTPTVAPSNATNKNVTYSSENTNVATVDSNGTITAKGNGTTRIVVTASGNTSIKGYVSVTVTTVAPSEVKPTSITVSPSTLSLEVGKTSKVTPTVAPSNATNKNVTYSSENTNVATVDSNGTITAKGNGTTRIVVTASGNTSIKGYVSVTVTTPTVTPPTPEKDPLDHSLWTLDEMMSKLKFRNTYTGEYYTIHNVRWGIHASDLNLVGGLKVVENPHRLLFSETLTGEPGSYHALGTTIIIYSNGADKTGISTKPLHIGSHNPAHSFDQLTIVLDELLKYQ